MVVDKISRAKPHPGFQYSLCRVVLMVAVAAAGAAIRRILSVLALSSRFDGRCFAQFCSHFLPPFSTRSVESF